MPPTNLFPEPESAVIPVGRPEPLLWVRRLALVADLSPSARLLRDPVEFRPGLNIVRVAARPAGETRPMGNSVGKTLLVRLIRYSLGEAHFGPTKTVQAIAERLPGAFVIAEVRLDGETWVTCRPLRDATAGRSFCLRADAWRAGLEPDAARVPFHEFPDAVAAATIASLPPWQMPGEGRAPRWLDVLGWLARDQECRFQYPNEWRDPDARSGTGRLARDDASTLSAWLMGLLDTAEIGEQANRSGLLADKATATAEAQRLDRQLESLRPTLSRGLKVTEDDLDDGLSEAAILNAVAETKRALADEQRPHDDGGELQDAAVTAATKVRVAETDLNRLDGLLQTTRGRLQACLQMSNAAYRASLTLYDNCPLVRPDCRRHPACTNAAPDPERDAKVAALEDELARYSEESNDLKASLVRYRAEAELAKRRWRDADQARRIRLLELGRADAVADDYAHYRDARSGREEHLRKVIGFQKQIDESLDRQKSLRGERGQGHGQLSRIFDGVMKALIGPKAGGGMALDARGLRPAPDATAGVSGAGLGTLAAVIGFDLACLAGAVAGVGRHPGFVVHDSPRNAEIEDVLYARVFDWVRRLEALSGTSPAGFQYIVTTTTAPPPSCDTPPFVRLVLDARHADGLLLGVPW